MKMRTNSLPGALEQHEPRMEHPLLAAVQRAMARAEAFAAQCRRKGPPAIVPMVPRPFFDPVAQEQQAQERDRLFQKAYVAHLTQALAQSGREVAELRARLAERNYHLGEEIDFSDPITSRRFLV